MPNRNAWPFGKQAARQERKTVSCDINIDLWRGIGMGAG
jgi:hypothetical protein